MSGVGGPLLCIGDLLSDIGEDSDATGTDSNETTGINSRSTIQELNISQPNILHPSCLAQSFQENFDQLDKAFASTDHTWTALTLKLCTALKSANKLVESTNSHVGQLSENVEKLQRLNSQRDASIIALKASQRQGVPYGERMMWKHGKLGEQRNSGNACVLLDMKRSSDYEL